MRFLTKAAILAAAGWSGYWVIGAQGQERLLAQFLENSSSEGHDPASVISVSGFPNRFDTVLTGIDFTDPSGDWGWQADTFRFNTMAYQINNLTADWPGVQAFKTPFGTLTLDSATLTGDIELSPTSTLPLRRAQINGESVALDSSTGWAAQIDTIAGALTRAEGSDTGYLLHLELGQITPPRELTSLIGGGGFLPDIVDSVVLTLQAELDQPIDRMMFQNAQPRPGSVVIEPSSIVWGASILVVEGALHDAGNGFIEGELILDVENWQPLFEVFKRASHLTATEKITLQRALNAASTGNNLAFTLNFTNGETRIGPFRIGPAPIYPF